VSKTAPALLTVQQAAARLGLSVGHTRRLIASGSLRVTRLGARAVRVAEDDLARFVDAHR
jgi:excisionase family DNA binding protein